jgi:hypothetical protein
VAPLLRVGRTACIAWDGTAGAMLVSVDGKPFVNIFPLDTPNAVQPGIEVGAGLFPTIRGHDCMIEYSLRGDLHLTPPSPDYRPFDQVQYMLAAPQDYPDPAPRPPLIPPPPSLFH